MEENGRYALWLNYGTEHYVSLFRRAAARFPDLSEAYRMAAQRKASAFDFLPERCGSRLLEAAGDGFMERYLGWLERHEVRFATPAMEEYPALLKQIHDPPSVLFYKGRLVKEHSLPIAVIGSRRPTDYGREMAKVFSYAFAKAGAVVVSGLATGIDACAARGALECGESDYPTVAVLGTGIDVIYPAENRDLYEEIAARGAVVTEFLPKTEGRRENFPIRNRIMSGMCRGVVVVEGAERSGTSITAGFAHDEGREVFAIPGRLTDPMSIGPNRMIQRGEAKPVFCANDVLAEFDYLDETAAFEKSAEKLPLSTLSPEEREIFRELKRGERTVDELCEKLPYPPGLVNSYLTAMQFSGIIKQLPGRVYALDSLHTVIDEGL